MAYDDALATRIRRLLELRAGPVVELSERKMFGGLAFMWGDHMVCGVLGSRMMARLGPHWDRKLLREPDVVPMDFTGRPLAGFLYVGGAEVVDAKALSRWVNLCLEFVVTLPPKRATQVPARPRVRSRRKSST